MSSQRGVRVVGLSDFYIHNQGVELHGLENQGDDSTERPPFLLIHGLWGQAEQFQDILLRLEPRKAYALSLRGRGRSGAPESGYTLKDHASDIAAFADHFQLKQFHLVTISAGAPYAISYAAEHWERLAGLSVTDYPAISKSYPPQMVEDVLAGVKDVSLSRRFLEGLQRESKERVLESELQKIECPVTVLCGGKMGSYMTEDHLNVYRQNLKKFSISTLKEIAHDPLEAPASFVQLLTSQDDEIGRPFSED